MSCDVYWGSHGCKFDRGHEGEHSCGCCECGWTHPWDEPDVLCVSEYPYYGPKTTFYGDDAPAANAWFAQRMSAVEEGDTK